MSIRNVEVGSEMRDLLLAFAQTDRDAVAWSKYRPGPAWQEELPDCDVMADRFTAFALAHGHQARTVECHPPQIEPWYDGHWFTVTGDCAIDWTARQFYNVAENRDDWLDPEIIPTPLVFRWPGPYPIPGVELVESTEEDH